MTVGAVVGMGLAGLALPAGAKTSSFNFFGTSIPSKTAAAYNAGDLNGAHTFSVNFDPWGDMFVMTSASMVVVALENKTLYGQKLKKNKPVTFNPGGSSGANPLDGMMKQGLSAVWDAQGNMYIADEYGGSYNNIVVVPIKDGKVFGQTVAKNTPVQLNPGGNPSSNALYNAGGSPCQMAFDAKGNLYIADYNGAGSVSTGSVVVVPKKTGTIFGQSATKNVPLAILAEDGVEALAFDAKGNLFMGNYTNRNVKVLPAATGQVFGTAMTANTWTELPQVPAGTIRALNFLRFDAMGNLYISNWWDPNFKVVAVKTGKLFGDAVTKNQLAQVGGSTISPVAYYDVPGFDFSPGGALVAPTDDAPNAVAVLAP